MGQVPQFKDRCSTTKIEPSVAITCYKREIHILNTHTLKGKKLFPRIILNDDGKWRYVDLFSDDSFNGLWDALYAISREAT
jgi:hypothetical protein